MYHSTLDSRVITKKREDAPFEALTESQTPGKRLVRLRLGDKVDLEQWGLAIKKSLSVQEKRLRCRRKTSFAQRETSLMTSYCSSLTPAPLAGGHRGVAGEDEGD